MAWDSLTLKSLKQLAINSIVYSSLNEQEKETVMQQFYVYWNEWLLHIINAA